MKFKEFSAWCSDRACDGCWGMKEAIICLQVCTDIYKLPLWKREKKWQEVKTEIESKIVEPINKMILERYKED